MLSLFTLPSILLLLLLPLLALSSPTPISPRAHALVEQRYYPQGTISSPANGTAIMPGQPFDFLYNQRGDYCLSSMNFSVWLFTGPAADSAASPASLFANLITSSTDDGGDVTGWYFGRFASSSYSNEFPPNPPPSQLTMPDFSKSSGGFSTGENASNLPMYLAVLEEWNSCAPTIGHQLSFAANSIVYNATSTSTS